MSCRKLACVVRLRAELPLLLKLLSRHSAELSDGVVATNAGDVPGTSLRRASMVTVLLMLPRRGVQLSVDAAVVIVPAPRGLRAELGATLTAAAGGGGVTSVAPTVMWRGESAAPREGGRRTTTRATVWRRIGFASSVAVVGAVACAALVETLLDLVTPADVLAAFAAGAVTVGARVIAAADADADADNGTTVLSVTEGFMFCGVKTCSSSESCLLGLGGLAAPLQTLLVAVTPLLDTVLFSVRVLTLSSAPWPCCSAATRWAARCFSRGVAMTAPSRSSLGFVRTVTEVKVAGLLADDAATGDAALGARRRASTGLFITAPN